MPCWLLLLNDSGFPLFSRSYGLPASAFSFPTMGLLSALVSSASAQNFSLTRLQSHDATIHFKQCTGGFIIVYATSDHHQSDGMIERLINQIYDAIMFCIGKTKLQDLRNTERT